MVKQCAWECLKAGKGPKKFRNCLKKKIMTVVHDTTHAEQVTKEIWSEINKKCS